MSKRSAISELSMNQNMQTGLIRDIRCNSQQQEIPGVRHPAPHIWIAE